MPIDPNIALGYRPRTGIQLPDMQEQQAKKQQLQEAQLKLAADQKAQKFKDVQEAAATSSYRPVTANLGNMAIPGGYIPMGSVQGPAQVDRGAYTGALQKAGYGYEAMQADQGFQQQDMENQKAQAAFQDSLVTAKSHQLELASKHIDLTARMLGAVKNASPELQPQVYQGVRQQAIQMGVIQPNDPQVPEQYPGAQWVDQQLNSALSIQDQIKNENDRRKSDAELGSKTIQSGGGTKDQPKPGIYQLNPKSGKFDTYVGALPKTVAPAVNVKVGGGGSSNDAKDIAAAIVSGDQAPTVKGLYRQGAAVRAELARQGFNLAQAESDWNATQKHLSTLNSSQQERLRQAVQFTYDSTDQIENLYNEWKQVAGVSGFKVLNKANLAVMKQLPGHAGEVATALEAQINDLTSELGTVYKGGNGSTDETLRLAGANLKADWNDETFKRNLGMIRKNLGIRKNSIINSQPAGVSSNNPYNSGGGSGNQTQGGGSEVHYKIVNGQLVAQ